MTSSYIANIVLGYTHLYSIMTSSSIALSVLGYTHLYSIMTSSYIAVSVLGYTHLYSIMTSSYIAVSVLQPLLYFIQIDSLAIFFIKLIILFQHFSLFLIPLILRM